eukprot:TRINITY_DN19466_c0_g1_i1.p1 TRINITY_DN19466_c0_g1~~TRINITY_DN19466_c0_g1_i1.p1  ORF type:complete len:761 (-),score=161.09 TRINITY_DN19466_c0_g1_i1:53-2335(-)
MDLNHSHVSSHRSARSPVRDSARYLVAEPVDIAATAIPSTCPKCGNVYALDSAYCRLCGHKRETMQALSYESSSRARSPGREGVPVQVVTVATAPSSAPSVAPMVSSASRLGLASVPNPPSSLLSASPGTPRAADVGAITPALRSWIECLVDNRVDQAIRTHHDHELAQAVEQTRREGAAACKRTSIALHQAEEARLRLEAHVRSLSDGQTRLVALVENMTGESERHNSNSHRAKTEALASVERVVSTVEELQRTVEQDADTSSARFKEHSQAIDEIRRTLAEDFARLRAATAELSRQQTDTVARQRQCADEVAAASSATSASRQELAEMMQLVHRLDRKLSNWKEEVKSEAMDEIASRMSFHDTDRHKLDALHRDANSAAAARIELESRLESLRTELTTAIRTRKDFDTRVREVQQQVGRRVEEAEGRFETLRSEVFTATATRLEHLEVRLKETQQALARRIDALQAAATEDVEAAKHELTTLSQFVARLEESQRQLRDEVSQELHSTVHSTLGSKETALRDAAQSAAEAMRRDMLQQLLDLESRVERVLVEQTTAGATRESFEFRLREGTEEMKRSFENQLNGLNQRLSTEVESWRGSFREELQTLQKKLGGELRAEARALFKQEQHTIAALDEQLWLTDQRLGQRIDELVQAAGRGERMSSAAAIAEVSNGRTSWGTRSPLLSGYTTEVSSEPQAEHSLRHSPRRASSLTMAHEAAEAFMSNGSEPKNEGKSHHGLRGAALMMAREAAETFQESVTE